MNHSNDVLILNKQLLIDEKVIINTLDQTKKALRARKSENSRGVSKAWSFTRLYNTTYYHFDDIPNNHRLGTKAELTKYATEVEDDKTAEIKETLEDKAYELYSQNDERWYGTGTEFKIAIGTEDKELALAKAVIVLIKDWIGNNKHKDLGIKKMELWEIISKSSNELCPKVLKHTNVRTLMNKISRLPIDEQELRYALIPKTKNNQNSRLVGKEENRLVNKETGEVYSYDIHQYLIFMYWMNPLRPNKLRKTGVYDKYKESCLAMDLTPVSLSTAKLYITKNRHWMSLERDGEAVFNDKFMPYISQLKAQLACSLWVADWSGTKLLYFDESDNKVKSLYMLRITDVATDKIVGWELVDGGEPSWAVRSALRKAVEFTNGYGCGEFVTDNGGAFNESETKVMINAVAGHHRNIQLGNKQGNRAEMYVKLLSEFARRFDNWKYIGFAGQHGNLDHTHNPDHLHKELLPNKGGAFEQVALLVSLWNEEKGSEKEINTKVTPLDGFQIRRLNGTITEASIANTRGVLKLFKQGVSFEFDLKDYDSLLDAVAKHTTDKNMTVKIAFDNDQADLYSADWSFIASIPRLQKSHSTHLESTEQTARGFAEQSAKKHQYKEQVVKKSSEIKEIMEDLPYLTAAKLNGKAKQTKQAQELAQIEGLSSTNEAIEDIDYTEEIEPSKTNTKGVDIDSFTLNQM